MSRRIRVLATGFGAVPGPNAHSSALMALAAALRGEIDFVTLKTENRAHQSRLGEARLFRVRCTGTPRERRAAFARAVGRQLEAEAYDIVHVRGPHEGVMVADLKTDETKLIYEVATFADESEGSEAVAEWEAAHLRCLESADLVLVGAEAAGNALADRGFGGKVAVVHPGVDVDLFDWWPSAPSEVTRVVYLGSFADDREIPTLLSALRAASQRTPLQALIAGDPDASRREQVQALVGRFDLDPVVTVKGDPRPMALPSIVAGTDLAIVSAKPTRRFQVLGDFPEPLLEYLACRRAVVAADVPAVAQIVRHEREGLLYRPGDESALADAIVTLATDADLREHLVARAYERVRRVYSLSARRRRIAEVYEMLAPESQRYDAWAEGFDEEDVPWAPISSLVELPSEPEGELPTEKHDTVTPDEEPEPTRPIPEIAAIAGEFTPIERFVGSDTDAGLTLSPEPLEGSDTN